MILFVFGHFFDPRKRKRRHARDEMPVAPLLQVLGFWMLLVVGGLFGALSLISLFLVSEYDVKLDTPSLITLVVMAMLAPVLLTGAMQLWWKLTRARGDGRDETATRP
jgi:multisubunit Na+/H+ antiporter MnhB subunit